MLSIEKAKKELKQVKIAIIMVILIQITFLIFFSKFFTIIWPDYLKWLVISSFAISLILNIVTVIGLIKEKFFSFITGMISGALILLNGLSSLKLIPIAIGILWIWSFFRIKPALKKEDSQKI